MKSDHRTAVLLDVDGTLVDTTYLHTVAWWRALAEAGEARPMAQIHPLIGMGSTELLTSLLGRDEEKISEAHGRFFGELHPWIRPLPGAQELLHRLHEHGPLVILVTSAKERDLPALLGALDSSDVIDDVVHGEEVDSAKPSPDLFEVALDRIDVAPELSVALGDAVWDIEAAKRAGVPCIGLLTGGIDQHRLEDAGAVEVYESCEALLEQYDLSLLSELAGRVASTHEQQDRG